MTGYAKLLGIDLKHAYAKSGWCEDAALAATPDTERHLKNHRCVLKPRAGGVDAFVEVDAGGKPLIPFADDTELAFRLVPRQAAFALVTDPAPLADGKDYQLQYPDQPGGHYLQLSVRRDFNKAVGKNIELAFAARKMLWVYYVVTDRAGPDSEFAIAAGDPQLAWKLAGGDDPVSVMLARQYPGTRVLRFVSEAPLPCRGAGLPGMRLLQAGTPVMQHLASPSWRNYFRAKMAPAGKDVDAMMQIVKYLSNTSLTKV